jgi:branched-chain amino acid transport system ATP-binding protein
MAEAALAQTPAAADKTVLSVKGLQAWYNESHILHGVDLDVREGEVVTLLGRNGAGKTTTLKAIMGIDRIARHGVAFCPEERAIFASLSVKENLFLPPSISKIGAMSVEKIFALFPNLRERLSSGGGKLSGGEQQMLAIARILRTGARFLMLDEPTEGLAPVIIQQIGRTIAELKREGFTILLVEQNFRFASTLADRFFVMEDGRIIDAFASSELEGRMDRLHEALGV